MSHAAETVRPVHCQAPLNPWYPLSTQFPPPDSASPGIGRTINMVHRGIVFRRTVSTLSSLDDRTLRDIGIARADIIRIAEEACDNWS